LSYNTLSFLVVIGLFLGMLLALAVGRYLGRRNISDEMESARIRLTAVEAAIFGLMGLLIAFTFSGAASRYELRRQLTVDEANVIGTAYLRLDLLPAQTQPALREKFRRYLEARIAVYRLLPDLEASYKQASVATSLQQDIWAGAIVALGESPPQATIVMIPALNQMFDITTSREIAALTHTPLAILFMLMVLGSTCSLLAGYAMAGIGTRHVTVHTITFALILTSTVYVILDLDYPRFGLIQLDFADKGLLDLLDRMK
jgi:hypothetical protein